MNEDSPQLLQLSASGLPAVTKIAAGMNNFDLIGRRLPLSNIREGAVPENDQLVRLSSSRRRRLWEVPHKYHCPIIGVCFEVGELRRLTGKALKSRDDTTDYALHTVAVSSCEERNPMSEMLNRKLDQRYAVMIKRFSEIKTTPELRLAWREVCHKGSEIPAGLWAACSHPGCDEDLGLEIYRDIHMIQHQVGAGNRTDLKAMVLLKEENAQLQSELESLREKTKKQRNEYAKTDQLVQQRLIELQAELASRDLLIKRLKSEQSEHHSAMAEGLERHHLQQRLHTAEGKVRMLLGKEKELEKEVLRLRDFATYAEATIEALTEEEASSIAQETHGQETISDKNFLGKCVLCVGGRPGSVNSYREVVEQCGGRFMHHDGGLEESKHRIDAALSAADIVICQAGCISHNAYWRVKEQCKRTGKLCMFVKNSGVSSFGKVVDEARKKSAAP